MTVRTRGAVPPAAPAPPLRVVENQAAAPVQPLPIYPILGLHGAVIGAAAAYYFIPRDYISAGALFYPALILTVGLLVAPAVAFFANPKSMFRVEHLLMVGLVYWLLLDLLQSAYPMTRVSRSGIENAFLAIGLFAASFWLACLFRPWRLPRFIANSTRVKIEPDKTFSLLVIFFVLGMFNYAYACGFDFELMFRAALAHRWAAPWLRGEFGGWESFRDHMQYFGYLVPTLTVVLALQRGWSNPQVIASVLMSLIIMLFLSQSGNRRIVGVTIGAAILFWMLATPRLSYRRLLGGAAAVAGLLFFLQVMVEYRNVGFFRLWEDDELRYTREYIHVDDNIRRLAQTIDLIPDRHPYVFEQRLVYTLVRPIPRVFWEGKPSTPGFRLAEALGDRDVSWSSSVIADWYMMLGFPTIFVGGLLYGRLAGMWSGLLGIRNNLVAFLLYCVGTMAIFASLRQIDELVLQVYPLLAWFAIAPLILHRQDVHAQEAYARAP
jgi:hypothetical protein